MQQNLGKRICLIVDSLSTGGAEKMAANLSIALTNAGYNVSIISFLDNVSYTYKGKLFNLKGQQTGNRIKNRVQTYRLFKKAVKEIKADYYIDFRYRVGKVFELLLHLFVYKHKKTIFTIHNYKINYHKPKGKLFDYFYKRAYAVVTVANDIDVLFNQLGYANNVLIHNFVNFTSNVSESTSSFPWLGSNYIVTVGRLTGAKQIDKLVAAYAKTCLPEKGIKLYVLGEGEEYNNLTATITNLGLNDLVFLKGFTNAVTEYLYKALFMVLSSKEEGFPMVILESLHNNTPVISFDCKSGPSEMIVDKQNGLLVTDQDFDALVAAMNSFVTNEKLYMHCKNNTQINLEQFSEETALSKWRKLLN